MALAAAFVVGCGEDAATTEGPAPSGGEWRQLAPSTGGFVSAAAFHPARAGEVWVSGDDGSGLYLRGGGADFEVLGGAPVDWASYSLAFDPNDGDRVFAPSHFGRGLAVTADRGASWSVTEHGALRQQSWNDLVAIDRGGGTRLVAATSVGLFVSDDGGATLSPVAAAVFSAGTGFQALALSRDETTLFAGDDRGGVFGSTDEGESWSVVVPGSDDGLPVTDLASTSHALYVGYAFGLVARAASPDGSGFEVLDTQGLFGSSLWTRLAAVDGEGAETDTLWVGTVAPSPSGQHGLFRSDDGGDSFVAMEIGGESVFALAVEPGRPEHVLVTSVNGPLLESEDRGATFRDVSRGVVAWNSLGLAQSDGDADHLVFGSTTGLSQNGRLFETRDGGASWEVTRPPAEPYGLWVSDDVLFVGSFRDEGLHRRRDGEWAHVLDAELGFREIHRDPTDPQRFVALTSEASTELGALGIYQSTDGGTTWAPWASIAAFTASFLPGTNLLVAGSTDVTVLSPDATPLSLGLEPSLAGDYVTGLDFARDAPQTLLVGTLSGALFVAEACTADTAPCAWQRLDSPLREALANVVAGTSDAPGTWFAGGVAADTGVTPTATNGVWRSTDRGTTWERFDDSMYPCRMPWRLLRDAKGGLLAGLWGGGAARFVEP